MNILFIYPEISKKVGGGLFTYEIKNAIKYSNCNYYEISFPLYENLQIKVKNQLSLYAMGMTRDVEEKIITSIQNNDIDIIIFNHSGYGRVINKIKRIVPDVRIITIFHNVEYKFVKDSFLAKKNPFQILSLLIIRLNESLCVKKSDYIICLNKRDSLLLETIYNRKADSILPICISDRFNRNNCKSTPKSKVGAFIGSNFYANNMGIKWFCENVSRKIDCKIKVIGKGFESELDFFKKYDNIELIGTVDNIDSYYYDVDFIVSPIFLGSGMKTKTAEALMFGKTIFGTSESFEGYDLDFTKVGALCNTKKEFIDTINAFVPSNDGYNPYSRKIYIEKHSQCMLSMIISNVLNYVKSV